MLLENESDVPEERAAQASWRKSGALAAMACTVGAACASDSMEVIESAGRFGSHAGMVAQLVNDIDGILKGEKGQSADIVRRKKTLPVAFALNCAREERIPDLLDWYAHRGADSPERQEHVAHTIRDLGGLHYTWAVAEVHRARALDTVQSLERRTGRPAIRNLSKLVSSLDPE
jgi:geranylgeranyl diphosphate synthase, type I